MSKGPPCLRIPTMCVILEKGGDEVFDFETIVGSIELEPDTRKEE